MKENIDSGCVSGDCFNGTGKRVYENGYYEGEFKDGLFHGKGFLKHEIGFYKGEFKEGKRHGKGEEFFAHKKNGSHICEGTYKNDEYQPTHDECALEVTEDCHYEVILKLNNQLIVEELIKEDMSLIHSLCDKYDAREVVNLSACEIFRTSLNDEGYVDFNTVKEMNEYHYICLFFNALFFITREMSKKFSLISKDIFGLETDETQPLTTDDKIELMHWIREDYDGFINSNKTFEFNMNTMINSFTKKNVDSFKYIYNFKYDANFVFENFSFTETKVNEATNQTNANKIDYKFNNEFTLKFSLINKNYPEEFRHIGSKIEKVYLKYK